LRKSHAGSVAGVLVGIVMLLVALGPVCWFGPRVMMDGARELVTDPEFRGSQGIPWLLLGFILAVPFTGLALVLAAVSDFRRK
jgi:hypothetical protein